MNLDFCPNKKSKEFKELVSAVGGEDKAYFLWMRNRGNHLDKAPNGADSKLFRSLLDYFKGDREQAIRAKAKVYTNEFFGWFGDWTLENKENVSKVVDKNGEPLVVYHTVNPKYNADIRIFDTNIEGRDSMIYTTDDKTMSSSYAATLQKFRDIQEVQQALDKKLHELNNSEKYINKLLRDDLGYSDDEIKDLGYSSKNDPDFIKMRKNAIKNAYASRKNTIDEIHQLEFILAIPESINYTKLLFVNIKHPFVLDAWGLNWNELTLDENLDPAVVSATKTRIHNRRKLLLRHFEELAIKEGMVDEFAMSVLELYDINEGLYYEILEKINLQLQKEFNDVDLDVLLKTRDVEDIYRNDSLYDGLVFKNVKDWGGFVWTDMRIGHTVFAAKTSNQIKSAVKNNGQFSTGNDNIYYNLAPEPVSPFGTGRLHELNSRKYALERELDKTKEEWGPLLEQMKAATYDTLSKETIEINGEEVVLTQKPNKLGWIDNNLRIFTAVQVGVQFKGNTIDSSLLFPSWSSMEKDKNYWATDNVVRENTKRFVYEMLSVLKDNGHSVVYSPWSTEFNWPGREYNASTQIKRMSELLGIDFSKIATSEYKRVKLLGPDGKDHNVGYYRIVFNIDIVLPKLGLLGHNKDIYNFFNALYNQKPLNENKTLLINAIKAKEEDLRRRQHELFEQLELIKKDIRHEEWKMSDLPFNITQGSLIWAVLRDVDSGSSYEDIKKLIDNINYTYGAELEYNPKTRKVYGRKLSQEKDYIRRTRDINVKRIESVVNYLNKKFGGKIEIIQVDEDDWLRDGRLFDGANSCIINDTVYLRKSRMTTEIAAEEMLHVLVHAMKRGEGELGNLELFDNLFSKAKKSFPKLWDEIQAAYKYNKDEELVTQVLARYLVKDFDKRDSYGIKDLLLKFKDYIVKLFKDVLSEFGYKKYTTLGNINPLLDFLDISDMILAKDLYFDIQTIKELHEQNLNNKLSEQEFHNLNGDAYAQQTYDVAEVIDAERSQYVEDVVAKYKERHSDATDEQIMSVRNNARIEFNKNKVSQISPDESIPKDVRDFIVLALSYEDLHQAEGIQPILDRINGTYNESKYLTEKDKDMFNLIKLGTKVRLRSQYARVVKKTKLIDDLKQILEIIDRRDQDNVDDVFNTIKEFLLRAENEIELTTRFIKVDMSRDISTWDPLLINYIQQDLIGYYEGLLKSLKNLFSGNSAIIEYNKIKMEDPTEPDLALLTDTLYKDLESLKEDYQSTIVLPYAEKALVDFVNDCDLIDDKVQFIKNMKTWLYQDTAYGDIKAAEVVIGMASRSKSPIVRIVEKMMSDVEFERNRQVLRKGKELINLYNKIRPFGSQLSPENFLKMFIELDGEDGNSGMPTGYFLRDRNYGRFYKEKDAFEQSLREKYKDKGVTWKINEYSGAIETIFPEENTLADNSVYNQYYDELDEWLDKHCERRYKLEYYKKKRRMLSPEALEAQQLIQHQIDILCQKAMDEDGWVDSNKLTPHEKAKLASLKKLKKELACPYIFRTNANGIVTLEEKVGKEAEIADQITKWNKYILNRVQYKANEEKYQKALAKYPEGSPERERFIKDNRIKRINPELFDAIDYWWNGVFEGYGEEYDKLKARHRAIINHLKEVEGFGQHNLDIIGTGINEDASVWKELKRLEQEMSDIKKAWYEEHGEGVGGPSIELEEGEEAPQYLDTLLVVSEKEAKTVYDYLLTLYLTQNGTSSLNKEAFDQMFSYVDRKGNIRMLKAFGYIAPSEDTFKYDPNDESEKEKPSFVYEYSSQFYEIDESSDLVNDRWDKTLQSSLLPKVRAKGTSRVSGKIDYTNDRYEKVMANENYKKFYDLLISTMEEANSMIPQRAIERKYLMPQITARGMQALGRSRSLLDLLTAVGYMFQDVFTAKFAEKDQDVSTNWDLPRRPDGSVVNNIPIRFVKRLDLPELISTDVIGAVMMYYDMAVNYSLKSQNLPSLELMKEAINPEKSTGSHKLAKQYEKVKNLLDFRYYGKEDVIGDDTKAPSELNKKMTNIGKKFRRLASLSMLAINFTTIEVGYIDAMLSAIADSVGGKYFTKTDLMHGYGLALRHLPNIIANIGNPATSDWMIAAMQYNQLSRSNSEIFDRTDQSRFRKALNQVLMGGYTMADYLINTMILGATYNHYRLVDSPDGKSKKFMSKSDVIREYAKIGYTEQLAVDIWAKSKTTLELAYYVKDGVLTVKDDFKPYVTKKLENQIAGRMRDRTAVYNGVIPAVEKAKVQQNVWGSYLTLMRNFYVNTYWERASTGYDTATEEEIASSKFGMRSADSAGFVNFETGESGNGLWWSFLKGLYKYVLNVKLLIQGKDMNKLTRDQRYAVKRILSEIVMIAGAAKLMLLSIAFARANDYDDDKDPTWTVNLFDPENQDRGLVEFNSKNYDAKFTNWLRWKLALLSVRTFTERSTFYWPGTAVELISSPSTAKSYLDDLGYNLELWMDLFEINGHDKRELVKTGGYRGMTRGTRDILKITGFTGIDNIVRGWHTSGIKSTLNWYQLVSPNNFLIPTKTVWMEENGLKKPKEEKKKKITAGY